MPYPKTPIGATGKVTITKMPDGRVQALTRVRDADGGYRKVRRVGRSEAAARRELTMALQARQSVPAATTRTPPKLDALLDAWFDRMVASGKWTDNTVETYSSTARLITRTLGDLPLDDFTTQAVVTFLSGVDSRTPSRVKPARTLLNGFANHLVREGHLEVNPVKSAVIIESASTAAAKERKARLGKRIVTEDELSKLRAAAAEYDQRQLNIPGPPATIRLLPLIELGYGIAGRLGEVLALQWSDIEGLDGEGDVYVTVRATVSRRSRKRAAALGIPWDGAYYRKEGTKNGVVRRVVLHTRAVDELRKLPRHAPLVFPNPVTGGVQSISEVGDCLRTLIAHAGLQDPHKANLSFHALRRTVATRVAAVAGIEVAANAIGDDPLVAKKHYIERVIDAPDFRTYLA